jgi:hypothetical protein
MEHLEGDSGVEAGLTLHSPFGQVIGTPEVDERAELYGLYGQGQQGDQVDADARKGLRSCQHGILGDFADAEMVVIEIGLPVVALVNTLARHPAIDPLHPVGAAAQIHQIIKKDRQVRNVTTLSIVIKEELEIGTGPAAQDDGKVTISKAALQPLMAQPRRALLRQARLPFQRPDWFVEVYVEYLEFR